MPSTPEARPPNGPVTQEYVHAFRVARAEAAAERLLVQFQGGLVNLLEGLLLQAPQEPVVVVVVLFGVFPPVGNNRVVGLAGGGHDKHSVLLDAPYSTAAAKAGKLQCSRNRGGIRPR